MKLESFKVEKWLNPLDPLCRYNLGSSCVKAFYMNELFDLIGEDENVFLEQLRTLHLHYHHGDFLGLWSLREAISNLQKGSEPEMVISVHGGTGANNIVISGLLERDDNAVVVKPSYQQHYDIPKSIGSKVRIVSLREENDYILDLDELKAAVDDKTKLISLSNPNNPTGVFLGEAELKQIAEIARSVDAYVLCDEIYRGMDDEYMPSIVDVYEKGISTSSTSKMFSMSGTRIGWIVTPDQKARDIFENRRSYDTICNGVMEELLVSIALKHADKILERTRAIVRPNKKVVEDWLAGQPHLRCRGDSKAAICLVHYDYDINSLKLGEDLMERESLLICHGDCFDEPHSFRLGFGSSKADLEASLEVLGRYLANLKQ